MLDRLLGLVTRVRPGEAATALLLSLNVCLLLTAYYVIKPVREALILSTGGAEVKSYAAVGQVIMLALLVPAYGALAGRVSRQTLIPTVTLGFASCLVAFYFAALAHVPYLGVVFYLFVGVFNLMVVAQFWALANDIYTPDQGERLFPVVAFGASIGAVAGSWLTAYLVEWLGVAQLLLLSSFILVSTLFITRLVESRVSHAADAPLHQASPDAKTMTKGDGGFRLVVKSKYLLMIAGLMFFSNLVNSTGEYILGSIVSHTAHQQVLTQGGDVSAVIGKFYADFYLACNLAGVALQALLVSRVIAWLGIRGALLVLPCVALGSYTVLALAPVLTIVRWAKTAENTLDYSLNNTVRNALFLPLTVAEKFKAKQATDTFFVRGGDVASAALVWTGTQMGFGTSSYAWINVAGVFVCGVLALRIGKLYQTQAHAEPGS